MATTLLSFTFKAPDYDPTRTSDPRISVLFTNFSRFVVKSTDIGIPNLKTANYFDSVNMLIQLRKNFEAELVRKTNSDRKEAESTA